MMPALEATKNLGFTAEEFVAATEALIQRGYFKGEAVEAAEMIKIVLSAAANARHKLRSKAFAARTTIHPTFPQAK